LVLRHEISRLAAEHLAEVVQEGDVVGVAGGRALQDMTARLAKLPTCGAVQLCGELPRTDVDASSVDITRRVAEASGGSAVTFYAPLLVPDADAAAALRREPRIADALGRYRALSVAVVPVGGWAPGMSTVYDALTERERQALLRAGAVAESCGIVLDRDGAPVHGVCDRVIGIDLPDLRGTR